MVDTTNIPLKEFKGIWIPNHYYFTYEPLPKKWEGILGRKDVIHPLLKQVAKHIDKSKPQFSLFE